MRRAFQTLERHAPLTDLVSAGGAGPSRRHSVAVCGSDDVVWQYGGVAVCCGLVWCVGV